MTVENIDPEELPVDEIMDEGEVSVTFDIAAYPSDLTLSVIAEMWKNGDILIPDFQRNFVWNIKQSSLLIESFLLGLPVPQVFFYIDEQNKSLVIDGQQRLISVVSFFDGYFGSESIHGKRQVFKLDGLAETSPFHKMKFADLEEKWKRKLKASILRAINIRQLTPKGESTSIYHIFERLNTGGTPLKPQEIRNCVFRGQFSKSLKILNQDANWHLILGKKTYDRHQKDVELVLRIFALSWNWKNYEKPMKEFLSKAMAKDKTGDSPRVKRFMNAFPRAAKLIVEKLGKKPFHLRGPLNSAALDSIFCTVLENLDKIPSDFDKRFKKLIADSKFTAATYYGTSDVAVLKERFEESHRILFDK